MNYDARGSEQLLNNATEYGHSSSPVSALRICVKCRRSDAEVSIESNGSFAYMPRPSARGNSLTSCYPRTSSKPLQVESVAETHCMQIDSSSIVGAIRSGLQGFSVWYCPIKSAASKYPRRRLRKTSIYHCESQEEAEEAVELLRKLNCWWGREQPPRIFICINPASGSGATLGIWKTVCQPVFCASGMLVDSVETQRAQHALELAQNRDLKETDAFVCLGGDGSMSEILQGLFRRQDWAEAVETPLCLIPGGTGNGLSASTGLWTPVTAMHALCKGESSRMDVVTMLQAQRQPLFSFLSTTFGVIANIDIGTENFRCLGSCRNNIGVLKEVLKAGQYRANVAIVTPNAASTLRQRSTGTRLQRQPPTPLLDSLGDLEQLGPLQCASLPQGWQLLERSCFSLFVISVAPWLALDFALVPSERVNSGEMTLTTLPGSMPRCRALQAFLKADQGKIDEVDTVQNEKILAFVIEPSGSDTWLVMDGEVLPFERVFAEIQPGLCRVMIAPSISSSS